METSSENEFTNCNRFKLRWFTPKIEVPLCGHATLASAAALIECAGNTAETLFFETKSGELSVQRVEKGKLAMSLPLIEAVPVGFISREFAQHAWDIAAAGNLEPAYISQLFYDPTLRYLIFRYSMLMGRQHFESIQPDFKAMKDAHTDGQLVGVIITTQVIGQEHDGRSELYDFYSRFFGPWAGIEEDPVTGSSYSILGPYWGNSENLNKTKLKARQCSARGGDVDVQVDREAKRVVVSGGAVVVIRGELLLDL
jgi:PhzF family phenazine biosynthesis protein